MARVRCVPGFLTLSLLFCLPHGALGDEKQPKPPSPAGATGINLKFPGGSLADYIKALREASPGLNVLVTVPEAREIQVPPIHLESVSASSAIGLIKGYQSLADGTSLSIYIEAFGGPPAEDASAVYKVFSVQDAKVPRHIEVRVWSIGDLIADGRTAQQILTAIETAVGLLKGYPDAQIRYHADTTLVVASGAPEQTQTIDRVVDGIRHGQIPPAPPSPEDRASNLDDLIQSLKESTSGPDANTSLHKTDRVETARLVELLDSMQQEIRERDRIIGELQRQLSAKKAD